MPYGLTFLLPCLPCQGRAHLLHLDYGLLKPSAIFVVEGVGTKMKPWTRTLAL
jgi:hypothetical protein